jgi:hypothetical protein
MFKPFTKPMLLLSVIAQTLPLTIAAQTADPLPDGLGKPIVQRMCTGCHNIRVVTAKRATHDQWETIVQQMVSRGADGTDDEIAIVIDYLARNFPPSPKPTDPPPPAASVSTRDSFWIQASRFDLEAISVQIERS